MKRIVEITDDGSTTLFLPERDEHYQSTKGALAESRHIFIDMGFNHSTRQPVNILEIGFGTGLNAWLTLEEARKTNRQVNYTGIELYPLKWETVCQLNYSDDILFRKMHKQAWEERNEVIPGFNLRKINEDFTATRFNDGTLFDVVYFDAFAPDKQAEMWEPRLFDYLYSVMTDGGILTTYCAKGIVRRMLQSSGFTVERLPGPPGGKREILRATKY